MKKSLSPVMLSAAKHLRDPAMHTSQREMLSEAKHAMARAALFADLGRSSSRPYKFPIIA